LSLCNVSGLRCTRSRNLKYNLERLVDAFGNVELRRKLDVCRSCSGAARRIRPEANSVTQTNYISCVIDDRSVYAILNYLAETIVTSCDHRKSASESFQAGVRKWIINRWQNENVRRRVNAHKIRKFAKKLNALRFVGALVSPTGD